MLKPSCANIRPTGAPYGTYLHIDYRLRRDGWCAAPSVAGTLWSGATSARQTPTCQIDAAFQNLAAILTPSLCVFFFSSSRSPPAWLLWNETRRFRSCCWEAGVQTANRGSFFFSYRNSKQDQTKLFFLFCFFFEQKSTKLETSLLFFSFSMWKNCGRKSVSSDFEFKKPLNCLTLTISNYLNYF